MYLLRLEVWIVIPAKEIFSHVDSLGATEPGSRAFGEPQSLNFLNDLHFHLNCAAISIGNTLDCDFDNARSAKLKT